MDMITELLWNQMNENQIKNQPNHRENIGTNQYSFHRYDEICNYEETVQYL